MIYHIVMWRWKPEIGEEEKARRLAGETMRDVREAMGLGYSGK